MEVETVGSMAVAHHCILFSSHEKEETGVPHNVTIYRCYMYSTGASRWNF